MSSQSREPHEPASPQRIVLEREISLEQDGKRFDQAAAELFPDYSRGQLQKWIKLGELTLDGQPNKPKTPVHSGQQLALDAELRPVQSWQAEAIELQVVYEDEDLLVINKPAGIVVHPAAGNPEGTLANAVLGHCPGNQALPRAGIVHRLDKDTSGLLMVAKSLSAHSSLVEQLQARSVERLYRAIVCGEVIAGGSIDKALGRHPKIRTRMAVLHSDNPQAKPAVTHYRVHRKFSAHTELMIKLETGRTHQIRVHMAEAGFPLLGDPLYLAHYRRPRGISDELSSELAAFRRQALHAETLGFIHPSSGENLRFQSELPDDYAAVLDLLARIDASRA